MKKVKRSSLIQKRGYDPNIQGDTLSLYLSNSPEGAQYLAKKIGDPDKTVVELCCSVGATLVQLANVFKNAIGIDIDSSILDACKKNLKAQNVLKKTVLIQADIRDEDAFKKLSGDIVIYDIPYWYPKKYPMYTEEITKVENPDLNEVMGNIQKYISQDIVIFAPPEMPYEFFRDNFGECEYVQIFINGKYDRNYVFFGDLIKKQGIKKIELPTSLTHPPTGSD